MLREFSFVRISSVFERHIMVIEPLFEWRFAHADVYFVVVALSGHSCCVYNILSEALAVQRAGLVAGAVAGSCLGGLS